MYLLDTNVVSELRKTKPHGAVLAWIETVADTSLFLSAVTLGEIQAGIELTREQDIPKAESLEAWANQLANTQHILPMDMRGFRLWAKLMHKKSNVLYEDAMIAATAKIYNLTVVTRNIRGFECFNVSLFNPFEYR